MLSPMSDTYIYVQYSTSMWKQRDFGHVGTGKGEYFKLEIV